MQKEVISLLIAISCVVVFAMNNKNEDSQRNKKLLAIFVTCGTLSYFGQTLIMTPMKLEGGTINIESDVKEMMEHVQIGESPF